jgi:hypothetical protein
MAVSSLVAPSSGVSLSEIKSVTPFGGQITQISTDISLNGLSTYTFTGLDSYNYLRLYIVGVTSGDSSVRLRVNGNSTGVYNYSGFMAGYSQPGSGYMDYNVTSMFLGSSRNGPNNLSITEIFDAKTSAYKMVKLSGSDNNTYQQSYNIMTGYIALTPAITSVTIFPASGTFGTGAKATLIGAS